ncbi:MAG: DUF3137 domain-containing protein [Saprospiraceae bacterium]
MQAFTDFRLFYNQSIYPELLHLELRRKRLIRLLAVSVFLVLGIIALQIYIRIFIVTLVLAIPVGIWLAYLGFRIRVFFQEFKPRVVGLILDFIDNDINFGQFTYDPNGGIPKERLLESAIFTVADDYHSEDLIKGQVRETPFELCELRVREFSPSRNRLDYVFNGIFLIGDYKRADMRGGILVLPDNYRKYLSRSERAFHQKGGRRQQSMLLPEFEAFFDTYATPDARVKDVLSIDMQKVILQFRLQFQQHNRQKDIYFSIIGDKIYLALSQDKNLLEPALFQPNVRFEVIREFFEDISLMMAVIKDVDVMN